MVSYSLIVVKLDLTKKGAGGQPYSHVGRSGIRRWVLHGHSAVCVTCAYGR